MLIARKFTIAATVGVALFSSSSALAYGEWQGTWDTDYGQIRLQRADKYVYGDYGSVGTIQGLVSADKRTLRGVFKRQDDGSVGHFEWRLTSSTQFSGRWNWQARPLPAWNGSSGAAWTGKVKNFTKPTLSVYKGSGNIGTFFGSQSTKYVQWASALYPSQTAQAQTQNVDHGLDFGRLLTPAKLKTAFEMQRHIQAISKTGRKRRSDGEAQAKAAFEQMDYELLGYGIITEPGPFSELLRAAVAKRGDAIVVSFKGTGGDTFRETVDTAVFVDGNIAPAPPLFIPGNQRQGVMVHAGFLAAYGSLRRQIINALKGQKGTNLFITGHSLGGAMAQLMAWDMAVNYRSEFASITIITSGSPRVGNLRFKQEFERRVPDNLRIIVNHDPVPSVPWVDGFYRHAGKSLVIGRDDAVLLKHTDHDVEVNAIEFGYHNNLKYYNAIRMLSNRASSVARLSPNGEQWARDATVGWYNSTVKQRVKSALQKAKEKTGNLVGKLKGALKR